MSSVKEINDQNIENMIYAAMRRLDGKVNTCVTPIKFYIVWDEEEYEFVSTKRYDIFVFHPNVIKCRLRKDPPNVEIFSFIVSHVIFYLLMIDFDVLRIDPDRDLGNMAVNAAVAIVPEHEKFIKENADELADLCGDYEHTYYNNMDSCLSSDFILNVVKELIENFDKYDFTKTKGPVYEHFSYIDFVYRFIIRLYMDIYKCEFTEAAKHTEDIGLCIYGKWSGIDDVILSINDCEPYKLIERTNGATYCRYPRSINNIMWFDVFKADPDMEKEYTFEYVVDTEVKTCRIDIRVK